MRVLLVLLIALGCTIPACSGDSPVGEYADEVEGLVTAMNARIDFLDAQTEGSDDPGLIKWYATERVAARYAFLDGFAALVPPEEVTELHQAALVIMGRLAAAEAALGERIQGTESVEGIDFWETPEGQAARAADADAIALCKAAEAELDSSDQAERFGDAPWVPPEMTEVVLVVFGCEAGDR